jgi:outer membrane PBP1 activator LpoA protein
VEAFTAASRGQPQDALRLARGTLAHVDALGISGEHLRWAWPLAARAAHELGDTAATGELLALLDACQPGHLAPMQRAERDLVRARLAAADDPQVAAEAFADAVGSLRELSTPYHLAHGLLDHAQFLTRLHNAQAAETAIGEARDIARKLRCQPLLDRAAHLTSATSPAKA